jgi:hypothetical protein
MAETGDGGGKPGDHLQRRVLGRERGPERGRAPKTPSSSWRVAWPTMSPLMLAHTGPGTSMRSMTTWNRTA